MVDAKMKNKNRKEHEKKFLLFSHNKENWNYQANTQLTSDFANHAEPQVE